MTGTEPRMACGTSRSAPAWVGQGLLLALLAFRTPSGHAALEDAAMCGQFCGRFFEVDEGKPVVFALDPGGFSLFGEDSGRAILDRAVSVWAGIPGSSLRIQIVAPGTPLPPDVIDELAPPTAIARLVPAEGDAPCSTVGVVLMSGDEAKV